MSFLVPLITTSRSPGNILASGEKIIAGRLKKFVTAWHQITSDSTILNTIQGYTIEFDKSKPIDYRLSKVARDRELCPAEQSFLEKELDRLLSKGVLEKVHHVHGEFISNIFFRPKPDGSYRMILNLKSLNESVQYHHFKMDTLQSVLQLIEPHCYMASIDLKDAYYMVPINISSRKYLRFVYGKQVFQYTCLPNGLASAPRVFTKLLKPVLSHLRKLGHVCVSYIDDIYLQGRTKEECTQAVTAANDLFRNLGFIVHPEKSVLEPSFTLPYLGFILNSENMTIRPKHERAQSAIKEINAFRKSCKTARELARVIGILVSLFPGVRYGPLFYRELEIVKIKALAESKGDFDGPIIMSKEAHFELDWWEKNLPTAYNVISEKPPDLIIETDASLLGWGAYCPSLKSKASGQWSSEEKDTHINVLELTAIKFGLHTLCKNIRCKHIRIMTDSITAVSYVNAMGGTHSQPCNEVTKELWLWALQKQIWLSCAHIPGKANVRADTLSRNFRSNTEWMLNKKVFESICNLWRQPVIDLFASRLNKQIDKYVSWKPDPNATFIDAFSFNWHDYFFYAFPPFSLIGKVLQKIQRDKARGIMVVPLWTTQPWFTKLSSMITDTPRLLPRGKKVLSLPESKEPTAHPLHPKLQLMACPLSGNPSDVTDFQKKLPMYLWPRGGTPPDSNTILIKGSGCNSAIVTRFVHLTQLHIRF